MIIGHKVIINKLIIRFPVDIFNLGNGFPVDILIIGCPRHISLNFPEVVFHNIVERGIIHLPCEFHGGIIQHGCGEVAGLMEHIDGDGVGHPSFKLIAVCIYKVSYEPYLFQGPVHRHIHIAAEQRLDAEFFLFIGYRIFVLERQLRTFISLNVVWNHDFPYMGLIVCQHGFHQIERYIRGCRTVVRVEILVNSARTDILPFHM